MTPSSNMHQPSQSADDASRYSRAYIIAALVVLAGIATSLWAFAGGATWALIPFVFSLLVAFMIVGGLSYRSEETAESFFFFSRRMPPALFKWTYVTGNVGLFSSIFYSAYLAFALGPSGMLYPLLAWFGGMFWFSRKIPALLPFFKTGASIHDFISRRYGHSDRSRLVLRRVTSSVTITLLWCSIAIEIKFGADIATGLFGWTSAFTAAAGIAVIGTVYTFAAGYRGATRTDFIQGVLMAVGAVCLLGYSVYRLATGTTGFDENFTTVHGVLLGPAPFTTLGMIALLLPYQFCVMDMWQRCIAIAESFGNEPEEQQIAHLRKETFSHAIPLFLFLFIAWYAVGVAAAGTGLTEDPSAVLPSVLASLSSGGWASFAMLLLILGAFVGAIISTFDTFLMALTQAFMYDWYGPFRAHLRGVAQDSRNASKTDSVQFVHTSRFWLAVFGISAVAIAAYEVKLLDFWVGMYSLMLALFPCVYEAIRAPKEGSQSKRRGNAAIVSILAGFTTAVVCGALGAFTSVTLGGLSFSDIGPLATLVIAYVVLWGGTRGEAHA